MGSGSSEEGADAHARPTRARRLSRTGRKCWVRQRRERVKRLTDRTAKGDVFKPASPERGGSVFASAQQSSAEIPEPGRSTWIQSQAGCPMWRFGRKRELHEPRLCPPGTHIPASPMAKQTRVPATIVPPPPSPPRSHTATTSLLAIHGERANVYAAVQRIPGSTPQHGRENRSPRRFPRVDGRGTHRTSSSSRKSRPCWASDEATGKTRTATVQAATPYTLHVPVKQTRDLSTDAGTVVIKCTPGLTAERSTGCMRCPRRIAYVPRTSPRSTPPARMQEGPATALNAASAFLPSSLHPPGMRVHVLPLARGRARRSISRNAYAYSALSRTEDTSHRVARVDTRACIEDPTEPAHGHENGDGAQTVSGIILGSKGTHSNVAATRTARPSAKTKNTNGGSGREKKEKKEYEGERRTCNIRIHPRVQLLLLWLVVVQNADVSESDRGACGSGRLKREVAKQSRKAERCQIKGKDANPKGERTLTARSREASTRAPL
ncbi:hypothetical protein B0H10DRAFT_2189219 [Mycena sp. CBHHK59/15]|nr:hypothetical protein B0H10DRAFT_2189219 [Mycena sp. CBHHK59/15]